MKPDDVPRGILKAASVLFGVGVELRRRGYDRGSLPVHRVDGLRVISVGNLRAGGSGKTPVAEHICRRITARGLRAVMISRGYGGAMENTGGLVSSGEGPVVDPALSGDEAHEVARRLGGVQVRVGADRVAQCREARRSGARVAVLDDGFQHRRLWRDLDILLVCPRDLSEETALLPLGPLREPPAAAARADLVAGLAGDWEGQNGAPPVLFEISRTGLIDAAGDRPASAPKRVWLAAGIARPERFATTAREARFEIAGATFFPDHHRFAPRDLDRMSRLAGDSGAEAILTTEKDMSRLMGTDVGFPLFALGVEARPVAGEALLEEALSGVL